MSQLYRAKKVFSIHLFRLKISRPNCIWAEKPKSAKKSQLTCTQCVAKKSNAKCTKVHFAHEPGKKSKIRFSQKTR